MKYPTGLKACIREREREREGCRGGGVQHANVLTASTAHKRNAKENAKESSGNGDGIEIFVVEQISGLRWNCCQIGYKQFLLGSPVYGVVFSGHHQLVLPLVVAAWYFWPAFFTYFSCLFLSSSTLLASK